MRLPRPVLIKPREKKNAITISQIVLLPKPLNAWLTLSVPESAVSGRLPAFFMKNAREGPKPSGGCRTFPAKLSYAFGTRLYFQSYEFWFLAPEF